MKIFSLPRKFYEYIINLGEGFQPFLLLMMRLFWGYSFFSAGYGKLHMLDSVHHSFTALGIPFPYFNAVLVSYVELIGGISLFFGLAARLFAIPLSIIMIVAMFSTNFQTLRMVLSSPQDIIVLVPFVYLLVCLVIFAFGPGKFSVDYLLETYAFKRRSRV